MDVQVRQYTLSQKEQEVKDRLFQDKPTKQPASKQPTPPLQSKKNSQQVSQQLAPQIPQTQQIDNFLKAMEQDFKQVSRKQVTMGMLTQQQEILKQHTEIINQNQLYLASIAQKTAPQQAPIPQSNDQSVSLMRQLLEPLNDQIREIRAQFEQTQKAQQQLLQTFQQGKQVPTDQVDKYSEQSNNLKGMLQTVDHNLKYMQPENLNTLQNFTNFNLQVYQDTIANLQRQIQVLQQQQETAETDLNVKYKQLNDAKLKQRIKLSKEADKELLEEITTQIQRVSHEESNKLIQDKLGGEMDYEGFMEEMSNLCQQGKSIMEDYFEDARNTFIELPITRIDKKDFQALEIKQTSILEELKKQLGIDTSKKQNVKAEPLGVPSANRQPSQQPQPQSYIPSYTPPPQPQQQYQPSTYTYDKPTSDYRGDTSFSKPAKEPSREKPEKQEPARIQSRDTDRKSQKKPKEPLVYRQKVSPKKPESQRQAYEPKLQTDDDEDNPPLWTLVSAPMKKTATFADSSKKKRPMFENNSSQVSPQNKQQPQQIQEEQEVPVPKPDYFVNPIPSREQIVYEQQRKYMDQLNQDQQNQFVSYDDMIQKVDQGQFVRPQEEKNTLVQDITRDVMRDKLQRILLEKKREIEQQKQSEVKTHKSTITDPPPQPAVSLQDTAQMGANMIFQGLVNACNNIFSQINQGLYQQVQQVIPAEPSLSDSVYTSNSDDSYAPPPQKQQIQQPQLPKSMLGPPSQQYTFAQDFNQKKVATVNIKDYYKQFEAESESISNGSAINSRLSDMSNVGSKIF